jgi:hypothetical protein
MKLRLEDAWLSYYIKTSPGVTIREDNHIFLVILKPDEAVRP